MLTDQQREYFDAMEQMFNTKGWKLFTDDLRANQEAIKNSIMAQADMEKFFTARGRYLTLQDVISHQQLLTNIKAQLEAQDGLDAVV